jgi:thiol-disulfide isomerase/thioredoxin
VTRSTIIHGSPTALCWRILAGATVAGIVFGAIAASVFSDEPTPPPVPRVQWLMFQADWCAPCRRAENDFRPWLEKSKWLVSPVAHAQVRLIDVACEQELAEQYDVQAYPTFVLLVDGQVVEKIPGYPGRRYVAYRYLQAVKELK